MFTQAIVNNVIIRKSKHTNTQTKISKMLEIRAGIIFQRREDPDNEHHLKTGVIWLNRYSTYPTVGDANSAV